MALWDYFTEEFYAVDTPEAATAIQQKTAADVMAFASASAEARQESERLIGEKQLRNELTKYATIGIGAIVIVLFLKALK